MESILKVNDIKKSFGKTKVLDGISFDLKEGESICLLGSSGSGKSTLLQIIAGLLGADYGEVEMNGKSVMNKKQMVPPEKRPINMVFQEYALWPHMTIRQNIEYGLKMKKVPLALRNKRIAYVTELLHLVGLLDRIPSELSGGQQQRVGIARALATEPSILLMDEPLSNLDVKLRTEMRSELASILGKLKITTIYVTHDMMEAFALADRIMMLHEGKIVQFATPKEMYEKPKTIGVAELMGYHNRLVGEVIAVDNDLATIQCGDQIIRGIIQIDEQHKIKIGNKMTVMLQLEETHICKLDHTSPFDNYLVVEIVQAVYEGSRWRYRLKTEDGQYVDGLYPDELPLTESIGIYFSIQKTRIF